jgi:hypothetical protein
MTLTRRLAAGSWIALFTAACATGGSAPPSSPAPPGPVPVPAVLARPAELGRPLRALVVGGGPTRMANQVAIESNVRYVGRILPQASQYRVLFADGDPQSANVQYRADNRTLAYRAPHLPRQDGSADLASVLAGLATIADEARAQPQAEVFLYFTGHGSPDRRTLYADNWFSLWGNGRFTVTEFARSLKAFPGSTPITIVMVQCFSGAFGNVLFEGGSPAGALVDQRIAGFFAAVPERVSAGCTPAINEAEYKDFTGYVFAALTGEDRMGRPVAGADYDRDGRVGMHEAFAWTLIHDDSIDTPVCTSDTFLGRFVQMPDSEIAATPYATVESWATPGQRAALSALSDRLSLAGDDRVRGAFERATRIKPNSPVISDVRLIRFVTLSRTIVRAHALSVSSDDTLKRRYADLLAAESRNPLVR